MDEELRAAEAHIARLEEELLRLKDAKRELEILRAEHQRLRRSAHGRAIQLLTAPVRLFASRQQGEPVPPTGYERWLTRHRVADAAVPGLRQQARAWGYRPLISILMATYESDVRWLRAAVDSVREQLYENWELLIADDGSSGDDVQRELTRTGNSDTRVRFIPGREHCGISSALNRALTAANGEWITLLDHDDLLEPDAVYRLVELLQQEPAADVIYSDEDKIIDDHFAAPMLKPDWSPELFLTHDYLGHFVAIRRELVDCFRSEFDGAQDYDLLLRVSERTARFHHLTRVLYHWRRTPQSTAHNIRRKPGALEAGRRAVEQHLARLGQKARVSIDWLTHAYRVRREAISAKISIVLGAEAGERLAAQTDYPDLEIVPAVSEARGQLLLFIDEDLQPLERSWLRTIAEYLADAQVGAVGARIVSAQELVESAGYVLMPDGTAAAAFAGCSRAEPGTNRQLQVARNYSAVGASCLLTPRQIYERIGGFSSEMPDRICQGIEYCLKLRDAGFRTVSIPYAEMRRKTEVGPTSAFCPGLAQRWPEVFLRDPYYNPNLSRARADFSLGAEL